MPPLYPGDPLPMRLHLLVLPALLIAPLASAQTAPSSDPAAQPATPAPAPAQPSSSFVPDPVVTPAPPPAPVVPAPVAAPTPPPEPEDPAKIAAFERECWTVDGPVEGRPALASPVEFSSYVRQKQMGALSRRAVYTTLGARQRLHDVEEQETEFFTRHRVFQQIIPAVVGLALVAVAPAAVAATVLGVVLWLIVPRVLSVEQNPYAYQMLNFAALGATIAGIPLAIAALVAATGPLALAIWRTVQLRDAQPGFLVDGLGFSTDEATRATQAHNEQVARRIGLRSTPTCSDR